MNYNIFASPAAHRSFRKLSKPVKEHLWQKMAILKTQPTTGEQLTGKFRAYRSLHLGFKGTQYRVVYRIDESRREILVLYVASRENFYRELEHLNLKSRLKKAA